MSETERMYNDFINLLIAIGAQSEDDGYDAVWDDCEDFRAKYVDCERSDDLYNILGDVCGMYQNRQRLADLCDELFRLLGKSNEAYDRDIKRKAF